jgi:glycerate dehydrogenase
MDIVVLDGYTLNPGDNPWTPLEALGHVTVHDRTPPAQIIERAANAEIILTNKTPLNAVTLARLPVLRFISVLATGYNVVDTAEAARRNILVANVPAYGTQSVAQHTFALILELSNSAGLHNASVQNGDWAACPDFCYWKTPVIELSGKILGIIGGGRIGRAVAQIGKAFGMTVWITPSRSHIADERSYWEDKSVEEIFHRADVISLHCPQTAANTGFVNQALLATMKPTAFLVNTARGGLINEPDLAEALRAGRLAGAAFDVVSAEPIHSDNPLLLAPRCIITPHIAWSSLTARRRIMETTGDNIRGFLTGRIQNRVN